jgi:AAA ATPase-like protein
VEAAGVFGREAELAAITSFVERVVAGSAGLVVEGDAGIGKTTVWREGLRRATACGFAVLSCRPAEAEAKLSFAALGDLLEGVPEEAFRSVPEPQRRALDVALLRADYHDHAPPRPRRTVTTTTSPHAVAHLAARLVGVNVVTHAQTRALRVTVRVSMNAAAQLRLLRRRTTRAHRLFELHRRRSSS